MTPSTPIRLARWLANNVDLIARSEQAGECAKQVKYLVDTIERMINRPVPPRFCGPCPHKLDDGQRCGTALLADRDAHEVHCWHCKTVHCIEDVEQQLWSEVNEWLLTPAEILMVMSHFGQPIAESTFRRWRATGKLQPRGYRNGKPRYWPGDVRALRNDKKSDKKAS